MITEAEARCLDHLGLDASGAEARFMAEWAELLGVIKTQSLNKTARPLGQRSRWWRRPRRGWY